MGGFRLPGARKPGSATSWRAFEPSTPAVTSAMQLPPWGVGRELGWGLGTGGDQDGTSCLTSGSSLWPSTEAALSSVG